MDQHAVRATGTFPPALRSPFAIKLAIDLGIVLLATPLAFALRYDWLTPAWGVNSIVLMSFAMAALKMLAFGAFGVFNQSWQRFTFRDLGALVKAVAAVMLPTSLLLLFLGPSLMVPRSIPLIDGLLTLSLMAAVRAVARYSHETRLLQVASTSGRGRRVLVIGAGEAGSLIVREMLRHPETGLRPVGFLDDDPTKQRARIATVPVLGTLEVLEKVVTQLNVDEVLIAIPSAEGRVIRGLIERLTAVRPGIRYRTMPGVYELLSGRVGISRIREVDIEDLLRRPPVQLDSDKILGYLEGQTVMVTGAGGSIGSELVRQICRFHPKELILFGHGENSIYQLERELDRDWPDVTYRSVIAQVQNVVRLDYVFRHFKPRVIFHTAAHKHVPLMELNPEEAVFNNIIGSKNLVTLALKHGVSHFVNISTDKAVNPTSVMGASKRMVEFIVQSAARQAREGQVFVSVRFGNVLGSRGSVIPVFKQQIAAGGPVTVTHPDMVRYFMTIPEASQLVLQASALGKNGEIYILDMGEPVRIVDLARDLIRLSGLEPEVDIPIEFSGMRPGEKLYEELMTEDELQNKTDHDKIFVAKPSRFQADRLDTVIAQLADAALRSDGLELRRILSSYIEGCSFKVLSGTESQTALRA
ncbi:MAG: polysaccharide biosynthesis protein [Truepera sp.]|nr:polysaccharide biosynthesis protein [Truepera sp.]